MIILKRMHVETRASTASGRSISHYMYARDESIRSREKKKLQKAFGQQIIDVSRELIVEDAYWRLYVWWRRVHHPVRA